MPLARHVLLVQSDEPLVMVRIGAAAFDGVDRHGRINPQPLLMTAGSSERAGRLLCRAKSRAG